MTDSGWRTYASKRGTFMKAFLLVGIASLTPFTTWAACQAPAAPAAPPSGATATREQMLAAQSDAKQYDAAVVAYADCMRKSGGGETLVEQAIEKLKKHAEQFNAELRAFKQANGAK
jgi:hypothetical protein